MSAEYTIVQAMNEIQELSDRIQFLGEIVDGYEMGNVDNIRSVGTMLEEFAGRLQKVRVALEEDYHLSELEKDISNLVDQLNARSKRKFDRMEKELEIFQKHKAEANREIDEQVSSEGE